MGVDKKAKKVKKVKKVEKVKKVKKVSADTMLKETNEALSKLSKKKETLKKLGLQKTVNAMASTVAKMAAVIGEQEERLVKLENTPAAVKSKAAYVHKGDDSEKPDKAKKDSDRATEINKRLKKLESLKEKLGPNNFAKQGFSHEAGKLMTELEKLA